jgi:mono/diheme cytochrome c family protein
MKIRYLIIVSVLSLTACGKEQPPPAADRNTSPAVWPAPDKSVNRQLDFAAVARGGRLFRQHCATCHGLNAQGAPDWRQRRPDGSFPAPPLDGTGHAWHHPLKALQMTIRNGTQRLGGTMPAWGDTLSARDIDDIIAWFQAKWPDEIYADWQRRNAGPQR